MAKHIKCSNCGGSIEWNCVKCDYCGKKNRFKLKTIFWSVVGIIFGLPILSILVIPAINGTESERIGLVITLAVLALMIGFLIKARKKNFIICYNTNCGYRGQGKIDGADNGCLLVLLFCCGVLPAILYILFCGKKSLICPKCGCKIR